MFHSDTFFPSIPTNNNETCSQLFIEKETDYMHVKPLWAESHSFSALQDFGHQGGFPQEFVENSIEYDLLLDRSVIRRYQRIMFLDQW